MIDLAVIIVTWNVRDIVLDALRTLYADLEQSTLNANVIVVDSASSDGTVDAIREQFPQTTIIASDNNLGFAGGNNVGIESLRFGDETVDPSQLPKAVYLLNPDTLTNIGATKTLFDTLMAHNDVGVVGARLTYGDGSFQHSSFMFPDLGQLWVEFFPTPGRFIEHPFNGRYPRHLYQANEPFPVDFMLGATMMLKREVIQKTGMFDLQFFMYAEEVDWQWRIHKAGWRILCVPDAHVVHLGGQSTGQVAARSIINLWQSRLYLYQKHYSKLKLSLAKGLIALGMTRKIQQTSSDESNKSIINAYKEIRSLALS